MHLEGEGTFAALVDGTSFWTERHPESDYKDPLARLGVGTTGRVRNTGRFPDKHQAPPICKKRKFNSIWRGVCQELSY
jgi:hypothetical protein